MRVLYCIYWYLRLCYYLYIGGLRVIGSVLLCGGDIGYLRLYTLDYLVYYVVRGDRGL